MAEERRRVWVMPRHPQVDAFYRETPGHTWEELLLFLITTFPQIENDKLLYIFEGGAAVHLLNPARKAPGDLDIIFRDERLRDKLNTLPAKPAKTWLESLGITSVPENIDYFFANYQTVDFRGHRIYLPTRVALAFTKSVPYWYKPPRPQDLKDIELLGVTQSEIDQFRAGFPK